MAAGFPALSLTKSSSGSLIRTGSPSRVSNFSLPLLPITCSGGNTVGYLGKGSHEFDATARDDKGLEAIGPQIGEQLQHRLEYHFSEQLVGFRMTRSRQPLMQLRLEFVRCHVGMCGR